MYEIGIPIGLALVGCVLIILAMILRERHPVLQLLFVSTSLFIFSADFLVMNQIAVANAQLGIATVLEGIYTGSIWISIFFVFYVALWYVVTALIRLGENKRKQKELYDTF